MSQVPISEAADLLALPGPDNDKLRKMILRDLLNAAGAGDIKAGKVAPVRPLPLVFVLNAGDAGNSGRELVHEGVIDGRSPVDFLEACIWQASSGNEIPKRALAFLSKPDQRRLAEAFNPPAERSGGKVEKHLMVIGAILRELDPDMRSKFKHGGRLNVSALANAVGERIAEEHGATHGFKESAVSSILNDALKLFPLGADSQDKAA